MTNQEINDKIKRLKVLKEQVKRDIEFEEKTLQDKHDTLDSLEAEISALEITLKEQI